MTVYGGDYYGGSGPVVPAGTFNGWAVNLNDVMVVTCGTQADWDALDCAPALVLDALTDIPDGLGLPDQRTEDVTYFQRDGVKHFSDWYEPRIITLVGTLGPIDTDTCVDGDCSTIREQLQELVQAWKRGCCDTELVIFPDCYAPDFTNDVNVYPDGTFDTDEDGWTGVDGATVQRVTSPVHGGAGSLEVEWTTDPAPYDDPASTGQTGLGATLAGLTQGDRYKVTARVYAATGDPQPVLGVKDTGGTLVAYSDPAPADDTWHQLSVDYTVPDSGELVPFLVPADPTTAGQLAYIDDVEAFLYTSIDRTLNGPFGIVGRPREFKYKWQYRNDQVVDFVARFDAVDHRMYVLDECGSPGYANCVNINPGTQLFTICMEDGVCFEPGGFCFTNPDTSADSVPATEVNVRGTELVYPTIVLQPNLSRPYIENMTTGDFITYAGTVGDLPITINTEDGTAFDSEGNSFTHLLGGSIYLSMEPGNYDFRLLSQGDDLSDGYAQLCWRDTVVNA